MNGDCGTRAGSMTQRAVDELLHMYHCRGKYFLLAVALIGALEVAAAITRSGTTVGGYQAWAILVVAVGASCANRNHHTDLACPRFDAEQLATPDPDTGGETTPRRANWLSRVSSHIFGCWGIITGPAVWTGLVLHALTGSQMMLVFVSFGTPFLVGIALPNRHRNPDCLKLVARMTLKPCTPPTTATPTTTTTEPAPQGDE